jgi:hypothetical protein
MLAAIVLPHGTKKVTLRDIPNLFANAIHPELPPDTPRRIKRLKKFPLTDTLKVRWCGLGPVLQAFAVSLSAEDSDELARECWTHLPPLLLPIDEETFSPYLQASETWQKGNWRLEVELEDPSFAQWVYADNAVTEYKKRIEEDVQNGLLVARDCATYLPVKPNYAFGEILWTSFVTVEEFSKYAAQFEIKVQVNEICEQNTSDLTKTELSDSRKPKDVESPLFGGEPQLIKGKNKRADVDKWVKFQANEMKTPADTGSALAERIQLLAKKHGYESERKELSLATITRMLPSGITGGRGKTVGKSKK